MADSGRMFGDLAMHLHGRAGVGDTVDAVLEFAVEALHFGCASVLLTTGGRLRRTAATSDRAAEADQLQLDAGEGPSLTALAGAEPVVVVADTLTDQRWPRWSKFAADRGIRSMQSLRLHTPGGDGGVLNLMCDAPSDFTSDVELAQLLALHASIALATSRQTATLNEAIDSHKEVGQAIGTLMERYHIDAVRAFALLRRYSQDGNVRLRELARKLNETGVLE